MVFSNYNLALGNGNINPKIGFQPSCAAITFHWVSAGPSIPFFSASTGSWTVPGMASVSGNTVIATVRGRVGNRTAVTINGRMGYIYTNRIESQTAWQC